jgi:hypothetical protein
MKILNVIKRELENSLNNKKIKGVGQYFLNIED